MKKLKMAIQDINEYLFEEYGNLGFDTQKLSKNIYLYLIGNQNYQVKNWIAQYGHLLYGWNDIKNLVESAQLTYIEIENSTQKIRK